MREKGSIEDYRFQLAGLNMLYLLRRMGVFNRLKPMNNFLLLGEMNKRTVRLEFWDRDEK